jgi:cytochrome P450
LDLLTLHRDEARHAFFRSRASEPPAFDRSLGCWVVSDPALAEAFLQDPHLEVSSYVDAYRELERKTGHSFANLIFALGYVPFCLNGSAHRDVRRGMAQYLRERRSAIAHLVPGLIDECLAVMQSAGELDMASQVIRPLATRYMLAITGVEADWRTVGRITALFDRLLGVRKRLRGEADVKALRELVRQSLTPEEGIEEEGRRLAIAILGIDSLFGTLGESLARTFRAHPGCRMGEMSFPDVPTETGVPHVERVVAEPFARDGVAFKRGDRIRILLQGFSYSEQVSDHLRLFGVGIHACLGRQLSLDLWSRLTAGLARLNRRVELLDHVMRSEDYVFACPEKLLIRLSD